MLLIEVTFLEVKVTIFMLVLVLLVHEWSYSESNYEWLSGV